MTLYVFFFILKQNVVKCTLNNLKNKQTKTVWLTFLGIKVAVDFSKKRQNKALKNEYHMHIIMKLLLVKTSNALVILKLFFVFISL